MSSTLFTTPSVELGTYLTKCSSFYTQCSTGWAVVELNFRLLLKITLLEFRNAFSSEKAAIGWLGSLSNGGIISMICLTVLTQYRSVTIRRTHGWKCCSFPRGHAIKTAWYTETEWCNTGIQVRDIIMNIAWDRFSWTYFHTCVIDMNDYIYQCWNWPKRTGGGQLPKWLKFCLGIEV